MTKNVLPIVVCLLLSVIIPCNIFGQENRSFFLQHNNSDSTIKLSTNISPLPNPILLDSGRGCQPENLSSIRFDNSVSADQRIFFCEALQETSYQLNGNWSPALRAEIQEIWQVFLRENVKIYPMNRSVSSGIVAAAEAFPASEAPGKFSAGLHLRLEKSKDKSFLLAFMHEMRHVYDYYAIWKSRSNLTEAELEKRGFRIMGRIYQEMSDKPYFFRMPTFWSDSWENLSQAEIEQKREEKIEKFMRGSKFYKQLLKSPEKFPVGYADNAAPIQKTAEYEAPEYAATAVAKKHNSDDSLPVRLTLNQTKEEIPQNVKEISFAPEKPADKRNPDALLRAAISNEKNLYRKMDNFVYDQTFQLQCWKKQNVTENYQIKNLVARTQTGETLVQNAALNSVGGKIPSCILDFDSIKTDAAETFWAASYLDQLPVNFVGFTMIDGIPVARYTVLQPTTEKFRQISASYPNIKNFRVFVGTIFVSVEDAQIIKFWGTSFPKSNVTGSQNVKADYCATAIRQKMANGIWVTTLLNTVALASENDKVKPYSYTAKYDNYRQATSEVKILDDVVAAIE